MTPDHVHLLVTPHIGVPELMQRLKGYMAREASRILNRTGQSFWQEECYGHWVRSEREWVRIGRYIEEKPVRAGLANSPDEYRWSGAARAPGPPQGRIGK